MEDEFENSECAECGGVTEPKRTTLDEWWGDELFLFEDVPVRTCRDCGEVYIAAEVAKRLEAEMKTEKHCRRHVNVPAVAYGELAA